MPSPAAMIHSRATLLSVTLAVATLSPIGWSATQEPSKDAPTATEIAKAGKIFAKACTACHLPPDPTHPTDRAWLNQVKDTA